jgi:hypothetical protein
MAEHTTAHEHRMSYGPIGEAVKEIDDVADGIASEVTHLVMRHEHEDGDKVHHHSAEELTGASHGDSESKAKPMSEHKPGDLWR